MLCSFGGEQPVAAGGYGSDGKQIEFQSNCRCHHRGPAISVREQLITNTGSFRVLVDSHTYPHLQKLAFTFILTPALLERCERLFFEAGKLVSEREWPWPHHDKNLLFLNKIG